LSSFSISRARVLISLEDRNLTIEELYSKDGKTEEEIAKIVGLSQQRISKILENTTSGSTNIELTREKQVALVRLILKGEKQEAIAEKFDVTQGYVSQVKTKFYDGALKAYRDKKLLKREVAERIGLQCEEIDQILGTFGDLLNFTPQAPLSCIPEPP
jgi:transcriptional regulator with XRE-family HTH domain